MSCICAKGGEEEKEEAKEDDDVAIQMVFRRHSLKIYYDSPIAIGDKFIMIVWSLWIGATMFFGPVIQDDHGALITARSSPTYGMPPVQECKVALLLVMSWVVDLGFNGFNSKDVKVVVDAISSLD
ncbi:hypothetical protein L6452_22167 [Arctium lappa]|uniref:Uncharacterized protein n=1 Tax=Arctium lappa TaxID=4217 RepID=A0ACB9B3B9_ARCLA|nr:hypothetical protein L6452_22167 [Arctium lappa]